MTSGIAIFQLSYSTLMLSYWFLKSLPLPTAESASCSLSHIAQKGSAVSGGRCLKGGTFTLKSLPELCQRAAKTVSPSSWNLQKSSCRLITSSSAFTKAVMIEPPSYVHSVSWALRL